LFAAKRVDEESGELRASGKQPDQQHFFVVVLTSDRVKHEDDDKTIDENGWQIFGIPHCCQY